MWDIIKDFKGTLPKGFKLKEDEDFAYLFFEDKQIARFGHNADPREIEKTARDYLTPSNVFSKK